MSAEFSIDGAERYVNALSMHELAMLEDLAARRLNVGPGTRITKDVSLSSLLRPGGSMDRIAKSKLGKAAQPVRAVLFDKREDTNWVVGWHQDRTIAVRSKVESPGFGPWSTKAGITHVEPPFEYTRNMITLRAHLDTCSEDNAPLLIAPGSHRLGRVPFDQIGAVVARLGSYACLASAGDIWLYPTGIIHASDPARNPTRRRVLQVDFSMASLPGKLKWLGL